MKVIVTFYALNDQQHQSIIAQNVNKGNNIEISVYKNYGKYGKLLYKIGNCKIICTSFPVSVLTLINILILLIY